MYLSRENRACIALRGAEGPDALQQLKKLWAGNDSVYELAEIDSGGGKGRGGDSVAFKIHFRFCDGKTV
jgi:hypothetical protein